MVNAIENVFDQSHSRLTLLTIHREPMKIKRQQSHNHAIQKRINPFGVQHMGFEPHWRCADLGHKANPGKLGYNQQDSENGWVLCQLVM